MSIYSDELNYLHEKKNNRRRFEQINAITDYFGVLICVS